MNPPHLELTAELHNLCSYCHAPGHTLRSCEAFAAKHPTSPMAMPRPIKGFCTCPFAGPLQAAAADCPQHGHPRIPLDESAPNISETDAVRELRTGYELVSAALDGDSPAVCFEGIRGLRDWQLRVGSLLKPRKVGP